MNQRGFYQKHGSRVVVCLLLLAMSLLLLGAGRVTRELRGRLSSGEADRRAWKAMMMDMTDELPIEHRSAWRAACADDPRFLLKMSTLEFKATTEKAIDFKTVAMNDAN